MKRIENFPLRRLRERLAPSLSPEFATTSVKLGEVIIPPAPDNNNSLILRLDFDNLVTASPPNTGPNLGSCEAGTDSVEVESPAGANPPVICGRLSGQHSE